MRIVVIGGAGVRTPLLVSGLAASDLPIDRISLYDTHQEHLGLIGAVARQRSRVPVECCATLDAALDGADFVFLSIRAGGIEQRGRDEEASLRLGFVGQETVGPAGFAMAMRTIPPAVEYARAVGRLARNAWIINFTNPVGIVTQAMRTVGGNRVVGICDTPTELFDRIAVALDLNPDECRFDYFGLNHLGWIRRCTSEALLNWSACGTTRRSSIVSTRQRCSSRASCSIFAFYQPYLFYYYRPEIAIDRARRAGATRGQAITALNASLFRDLAAPHADLSMVYNRYLDARQAGYMQVESGRPQAPRAHHPTSLSGYDRIAAGVVRAIHFNAGTIIPLSVSNDGSLPDLHTDDVVEVPCLVDADGATPRQVGPVPKQVRDLLVQVKEYERMTVAAALSGDRDMACAALAKNPLVGSPARADALIDALGPSW